DLGARGLDQLSVVHAGRASWHASHAAKTAIEMADPIRSQFRSAFAGELHQVDAAARRIHLLAPQDIRRADRQAETAVNALFDNFIRRRMVRVEGTAANSRRGR